MGLGSAFQAFKLLLELFLLMFVFVLGKISLLDVYLANFAARHVNGKKYKVLALLDSSLYICSFVINSAQGTPINIL